MDNHRHEDSLNCFLPYNHVNSDHVIRPDRETTSVLLHSEKPPNFFNSLKTLYLQYINYINSTIMSNLVGQLQSSSIHFLSCFMNTPTSMDCRFFPYIT